MKKNYVLLISIVAVLITMLAACGVDDPNSIALDNDHDHYESYEIEVMPERYTDMTSLISTLTTQDEAQVQVNAIGTTLEMTQVPILQAEGYVLRLVENLEHQYKYYFVPENQVNAHPIDIKTALIVYVAKSNLTYQSSIEQSDLQDQNGFAYYEKYNEWYINFDGKRVNIDFPDDIVLTSPEQIADYFTFETYYYTVPTDSGAVTE
ncbi:MAG: hypothetical protein IJW97_07225 [Clostridia bacterium]|nr:hypothetical protein [Clostridia bacterium]